MWKKMLAVLIPVVAAGTIAGGVIYSYSSDTEFTDTLDEYNSVTVDGKQALSGNFVTGRVHGRYSLLGWLLPSEPLKCPDLKAEKGASVTCEGEKGSDLTVPVRVVKTVGESVTWKFER